MLASFTPSALFMGKPLRKKRTMWGGRALLPFIKRREAGKRPSLKAGRSQGGTFLDPPAWTNQCATDMRGETNAHVVAFLPWGRCRHCDGRIARSCSAPRRDCVRPCVAFRRRLSHQSRPCGIDPRPFRGSDNLPAGVSGVDQATEIRHPDKPGRPDQPDSKSGLRRRRCSRPIHI
jgi:hypothetical protein